MASLLTRMATTACAGLLLTGAEVAEAATAHARVRQPAARGATIVSSDWVSNPTVRSAS